MVKGRKARRKEGRKQGMEDGKKKKEILKLDE